MKHRTIGASLEGPCILRCHLRNSVCYARFTARLATATAWHSRSTQLPERDTAKVHRTRRRPADQASTELQTHEIHPAQLTSLVKQADSPEVLAKTVQHYSSILNYIHAAATITRLAKLLTNSSVSTSRDALACITIVCKVVKQHLQEFEPRAIANTLWACSKLCGYVDSARDRRDHDSYSTSMHEVHDLAAELLQLLPDSVHRFETQHICNGLYACAVLHNSISDPSNGMDNLIADAASLQNSRSAQLQGARWNAEDLQRVAGLLLDASTSHLPSMTSQVGRVFFMGLASERWHHILYCSGKAHID